MQLDPKTAHDWVQLFILDAFIIIGGVFAFWRWVLAPIKKSVNDECKARVAADAAERDDRESCLEEERTARKAADAHRDERVREARDKMQAAVGRVEMLERSLDGAKHEREQLKKDFASMDATQKLEIERRREGEIKHERFIGEMRLEMKEMESRITDNITKALREAVRSNPSKGD